VSTPAVEVRSFAVTIPHGTPSTAPYTQDIYFPARVVSGVHWKVPTGPAGKMGWRLTMSGGNAVIPTGGGWIIADDESDTWLLQDQPDSGFWEVTGYNTGTYDHTVYLDFLLDLVTGGAGTPDLLPNGSVSATTPVTTPGGVTVPAGTPVTTYSTPGGYPVSTFSVPPVSVPAPVPVPPVSVPAPVSVPPVSVPSPISIGPVSVPVITAPKPVTVKQPVILVPVPDVLGLTGDEAKKLLKSAGFGYAQSPVTTPKGKTTKVIAQNDPKAGTLHAAGTVVHVKVSY
jgi:PASTA domain